MRGNRSQRNHHIIASTHNCSEETESEAKKATLLQIVEPSPRRWHVGRGRNEVEKQTVEHSRVGHSGLRGREWEAESLSTDDFSLLEQHPEVPHG